jgi:phage baseplate assembly protein W
MTNSNSPGPQPPVGQQQTQISFPFSVTRLGRTATANYTDHVRQLIRQVMFTSPGERVNEPDFGCNLQTLVFASRRNELAIAAETIVQGALQRWLGNIIAAQSVEISFTDNSVTVDLHYKETLTQQSWFVRFFN